MPIDLVNINSLLPIDLWKVEEAAVLLAKATAKLQAAVALLRSASSHAEDKRWLPRVNSVYGMTKQASMAAVEASYAASLLSSDAWTEAVER